MGVDGIDKRIAAGAQAIAAALHGPAGQIPLDRVVIDHLVWFDLCQQRGMTWPQIGRLLQKAGAGRENGRPFSSGHLSSVVWRQRQKSPSGEADSTPLSPAQPVPATEPSETTPAGNQIPPKRVARTPRSPLLGENPKIARVAREQAPGKSTATAIPNALPEQQAVPAAARKEPRAQLDGKSLLASMRRTARLRRDE